MAASCEPDVRLVWVDSRSNGTQFTGGVSESEALGSLSHHTETAATYDVRQVPLKSRDLFGSDCKNSHVGQQHDFNRSLHPVMLCAKL